MEKKGENMTRRIIKLVIAYLAILASILCYVTVLQKAEIQIIILVTLILPLVSMVVSDIAFN